MRGTYNLSPSGVSISGNVVNFTVLGTLEEYIPSTEADWYDLRYPLIPTYPTSAKDIAKLLEGSED